MSDTDKCPKCGAMPLLWSENSAFCRKCKLETHPMGKPMNMANVYVAMSHRIRELEARIAAKDAALTDIDMIARGPRTVSEQYEEIVDIAREALKK